MHDTAVQQVDVMKGNTYKPISDHGVPFRLCTESNFVYEYWIINDTEPSDAVSSVHVCVHVCLSVQTYINVRALHSVCVCIYIYIYIHTHTHTGTN
jgi:hypothetical protein